MQTYSAKLSQIDKRWILIDAKDASLGRLSALIALRLRGKHKPTYTPHLDCGDNIVVINAKHFKISSRKLDNNFFYWHTGYPGGIKKKSWREILEGKNPQNLLQNTVKRMLPKGPLGRVQLRNLYIYTDEDHKHTAQTPQILLVDQINPKNKR